MAESNAAEHLPPEQRDPVKHLVQRLCDRQDARRLRRLEAELSADRWSSCMSRIRAIPDGSSVLNASSGFRPGCGGIGTYWLLHLTEPAEREPRICASPNERLDKPSGCRTTRRPAAVGTDAIAAAIMGPSC